LNPESIPIKQNVVFYEGQAIRGTTGSDLQFNKIEGEEVNFEFFLIVQVLSRKKIKIKGTETLSYGCCRRCC